MSRSEVWHICSGSRDGSLAGYLSYSQSETFLIIISVSLGNDLQPPFRSLLSEDPLYH